MIKLIDSLIFFNRKCLNSTNINNIALNSFSIFMEYPWVVDCVSLF